jgi:hypothetical protein
MSNKSLPFVKVGTNRKVRIECALTHMTYIREIDSNPDRRVTVEADNADVYMEVDGVEVTITQANIKTQPGSVHLETARKNLANAIQAAKKTFEHDTGTVLTDLTVDMLQHSDGMHADKSEIINVLVSCAYPGPQGAVWSAL